MLAKKQCLLICVAMLAGAQLQAMSSSRRLLGATAVAAACSMAHRPTESTTVKPDWAVKHIPNGVPKQLEEQVQFMRNPHHFTRLGAELPKGLLLYGPPGTGKTSIVRAMAEELDATLISASGSDFTTRYYGDGAKKVRAFFEDARSEARRNKGKLTIAFIDEIDLIAPQRGSLRAHGYGEQITAFLTEIDGFKKDQEAQVYIIGATNLKEKIDPAILRAGRLETHILIDLPDLPGRAAILRHYLQRITYHGKDLSLELAERTTGLSGADLKKIVNDAAIIAGSEAATAVREEHLLAAADNLLRPALWHGRDARI